MTNKAESDWRAFRRYETKGVTIAEENARITFSHKDQSYKGLALQVNLMGFLVVPLVVAMVLFGYGLHVLTPLDFRTSPFIIMILSFFIPSGLFLLLLQWLISFESSLTIEPGVVRWKEKNHKAHEVVIPIEEIRSIDVRVGEEFESSRANLRKYKVVIWHGPVPIYTIASLHEDTAVMLKEGVVAAIGVLNARFAQAGPRGRTPAWE